MACGKNQGLTPVKGHEEHWCTECKHMAEDESKKSSKHCYSCSGNWNRGLKKAVCKWEAEDSPASL